MLKILASFAQGASSILDFGCGNGRYVVSLLPTVQGIIYAYDVCEDAVQMLDERLRNCSARDRVVLLSGNMDTLKQHGPFDVILCLFGVLAHIPHRRDRIATLRTLATLLRPHCGAKIVISVPNGVRRFLGEQTRHCLLRMKKTPVSPALEQGDILYTRQMAEDRKVMFYHMYTVARLCEDLRAAHLHLLSTFGECVLPESLVTQSSMASRIDSLLLRLLPVQFSYGIAAVAEMASVEQ